MASWPGLQITFFKWIAVYFRKCTRTPSKNKTFIVVCSYRLVMLYTTLSNATTTEHSLEPKLIIECSFRLVLLQNSPLKEVTVQLHHVLSTTLCWEKLLTTNHATCKTSVPQDKNFPIFYDWHPDINPYYSLIPYCGLDTARKLKSTCTWVYVNALIQIINSKKIFSAKRINGMAAETIGFNHIVCYIISTTDFIVLSCTRVSPRSGTRFSL